MSKYRLSDSALDVLHLCERKFQLDRLLVGGGAKEDYPDTIFGKAYGVGVAEYLNYPDIEQAIFKLMLAYTPHLESEKKSFLICVNLLLASKVQLDNLLQDWEVASFNGKPAIELNFRLNIDELFYFVGYIDVVLRNKWTGRYAIWDAKTTGLQLLDLDPLFKNSGQCLGYSIVLDEIVGESQAEYDVGYLVGQLDKSKFSPKVHTLIYPKTLQDRLNWFITLGMDVEHLHKMFEMNVFPMRGKNCLQYMKPCKHLGTCHLRGLDEYKEIEEDRIEYQFVYNLDDVIENHLKRIGA